MNHTIYKPTCGETIREAAEASLKMANRHRVIKFTFNGVEIKVYNEYTVEDIIKQYHEKLDEARRIYEQSDEYKESQRLTEIERGENQKKMDSLMLNLDKQRTHSDFLDWFYEAIYLIDNIHVNVDRQIIKDYLIIRGYEENWGLNQPKEFYKNKSNFARYIIGQIMNCWHPLAAKFIEDYREMV